MDSNPCLNNSGNTTKNLANSLPDLLLLTVSKKVVTGARIEY